MQRCLQITLLLTSWSLQAMQASLTQVQRPDERRVILPKADIVSANRALVQGDNLLLVDSERNTIVRVNLKTQQTYKYNGRNACFQRANELAIITDQDEIELIDLLQNNCRRSIATRGGGMPEMRYVASLSNDLILLGNKARAAIMALRRMPACWVQDVVDNQGTIKGIEVSDGTMSVWGADFFSSWWKGNPQAHKWTTNFKRPLRCSHQTPWGVFIAHENGEITLFDGAVFHSICSAGNSPACAFAHMSEHTIAIGYENSTIQIGDLKPHHTPAFIVKKTLRFDAAHGKPILLSAKDATLTVVFSTGRVEKWFLEDFATCEEKCRALAEI